MRCVAAAFVLALLGCADEAQIIGLPVLDGGPVDAQIDVAPIPDTAPSCVSPNMLCGTTCTDVTGDPMNCGGCSAMCPSTHACVMGLCIDNTPTAFK